MSMFATDSLYSDSPTNSSISFNTFLVFFFYFTNASLGIKVLLKLNSIKGFSKKLAQEVLELRVWWLDETRNVENTFPTIGVP